MKMSAWLASASVLALSAVVACSSTETTTPGADTPDDGERTRDGSVADSQPSPEAGLGELLFRPETLYTGVDGTHTFIAPVAVYDADGDLTVTASDPSAVTITPTKLKSPTNSDGVTDNGKYFLATAKKAGQVTLTATSKGRSVTASLTITDYAAGRYAAGEARYNKAGSGQDQPCTNCHAGAQGIDHSPAAMASATDQDIGVIVTTGIKPPAKPITGVPGGHKWNVTAEEKDGLITYLRALQPRGFE